jgi:hypothetical protein
MKTKKSIILILALSLLSFLFLTNISYSQDNNQNQNVFSWGNLIIADSPAVEVAEYPEGRFYGIGDAEFPLWANEDIHTGTAVFLDENNNMYRNRAGLRYFPVTFQGDNFFVDRIDGFITSNNTKFIPAVLQLETALVPGKYLYILTEDVRETLYYFEK